MCRCYLATQENERFHRSGLRGASATWTPGWRFCGAKRIVRSQRSTLLGYREPLGISSVKGSCATGFARAKSSYMAPRRLTISFAGATCSKRGIQPRFRLWCRFIRSINSFSSGSRPKNKGGNIEGAKIELVRSIRGKDGMIIWAICLQSDTKTQAEWACAPNRRVPY